MSKLLKLKSWLTIEETASRLSVSAGELVTAADVLRYALEGHLTLSVYFVNHAQGRPARIEPLGAAHFSSSPLPNEYGPPTYWLREGDLLPNKKEVLILEGDEQEPERLKGVWDLMMLGAEKIHVECEYQDLIVGPDMRLICLGGPLVTDPTRTKLYQVLDTYIGNTTAPYCLITEPEEGQIDSGYEVVYHPAAGLPEDSMLVVRTAALLAFENTHLIEQTEQGRADQQGENRPSRMLIIAALLELLKAPVDRPRPQGINQEAIKANILERFKWRGLSDRTLQEVFADANRAKKEAEKETE